MPLPSSGIIVVEKPSTASNNTRITNNSSSNTTTTNANNPVTHQQQQQHHSSQQQQNHIQYYEYYDVNENQPNQQQQQQHSTIVVDGTVYHQQQQQQIQLGGLAANGGGGGGGRKSSFSSSSNKSNLSALKTGPMPQNKQYSSQQQQNIIQHTSHTNNNPQQHVQQVNLATASSSQQHQTQHLQQQQPPPTHMIQVSEEFLEQATNSHNTSNMMISTTGEVIQQQQIFKIVSTDATTGNMIIDTSNQNPHTTTPKVLLSNLTVLSKQQQQQHQANTAQQQLLTNNQQQQQSQATGQTINFVNAKNLYTTTNSNISAAAGQGKQQKFTVATTNVANYKSSSLKQSTNTQYIQQSNTMGQQKLNITSGNRNMQMLSTARVQPAGGNSLNSNNTNMISGNTAQTMVLQQPQKFVSNNANVTKTTLGTASGNVIKKSGTLRMNNSNTTTTKLMNNLHTQSTQGVKTFITQTSQQQQQQLQQQQQQHQQMQQQNLNQLTLQQHHATTTTTTKGGKSKFVKQYNNAILNSAGAVAIATLPHQQQTNTQQQNLQAQSNYINHHKVGNKINKINSKYGSQTTTSAVAAQLPPGTQLHQKTVNQSQHQQQYQSTSNSNIKFVNAQGTIIQQQQQQQQQHPTTLTTQKLSNKHHQQQQQQYQNVHNFDTVDGNHLYTATSSLNSTNATGGSSSAAASSLLTDDIMMVNGTQMTDELSARILQSMSQKSFSNQRYQQQHQPPVYQTKSSSSSSSIAASNNNNMLPPPPTQTSHISSNNSSSNNNSNILLSPREYTLYPPTQTAPTSITTANQHNSSHQQQSSSPNQQYSLSSSQQTSSSSNQFSSGSFSSNYNMPISNNNMTTTITPHSTTVAGLTPLSNTTAVSAAGTSTLATARQIQSAPNSRSQSMERKLHESSMSRKSTEYYKVNIKDYHQNCAFVAPTTASIYATNSSPSATSLIDFIIPLPSCTTITSTNNINSCANVTTTTTATSTCATMTTTITNATSCNNNNSNHNSLRGSHNNLATAQSASGTVLPAGTGISGNISSSSTSNLMGVTATTQSSLPTRPPSIPPAALMEPQAQVIHLQATKTLPGANSSSNDDDDIIGEEIRPVPVETEDIRLRILHAVLFDHTYVNPMPLELPTTFAVQLPPPPNSTASQGHMMTSSAITAASGGGGGTSTHTQQWSLGGIGAVAAATAVGGVSQQNYAIYGTQLSRLQHDDDSYSTISNTNRLAVGDIDPGEETETAPEAELEDDSITRCICDLTHDDGYMICCDKCCAWQHVDCMGIDRQNIPDEYLCELCQPRAVDKARARSLQLMKRKEQTQLMLTAQAQAAASAGTIGAAGSASGSIGGVANLLPNDVLAAQQRLAASGGAGFNLSGNMTADAAALQLLGAGGAGGTSLKKGAKMLKKVKDTVAGKKSKKAEKLAAAAAAGLTGCKPARKETKKNTKRKKAAAHEGGSTVGMTAAEKHAANLRQWIENYELAVTNHYSPELRARLHAITKQPSLLQSILNTENPILKEFSNGSLENRATTVPHAGGKILISNLDIVPNSPICELRGKYMLTTQYKTQNTSMNMNTPPPNNYHLASYKAHKTPGPFIFFYQLPGAEVTISCHLMPQTTTTTTLNPDGTYTTTTTTLPSQQSPPTYLKGPEICVDTRTYGNEARFVRRSCRPNAEIQHLFEKGTIHLFIVALTDIRASTEITIRHEPHDLLAVENKKSSSMVIQPTSTQCACGLTKDCLFGPPLPQLPPAAKSNAGRKALQLNGGATNTGNLTAKQRKANQQNMNRNRSISSSASGDSNMGGCTTSAMTIPMTVPLGLNSPNTMTKVVGGNNKNMMQHTNNALMPLMTATCNNSNLSNASSTSSTLNSIMHDSGICTSSSSPSVSIPSPSPIQHIHSPIQQQQQQQQQQQAQQFQQQQQHLMQHIRPNQILPPQQQHHLQQQPQLMQTVATPVMLATPDITTQQPPPPPQQQTQQLVLTHQITQNPQQQQPQPLTVIHQAATVVPLNTITEIKAEQPITTPTATLHVSTPQLQQQQQHHPPTPQPQLQLMSPQQTLPAATTIITTQKTAGLMDIVTPETTIAAAALQSLNTTQSPNVIEIMQQPPPKQQQQQQPPPPQYVLMPVTEVNVEHQQQQYQQQQLPQLQSLQPTQTLDHLLTANTTNTPSVSSSVCSSPQQHKSPQKNQPHSQHNNTHPGRKTPAKNARTTSFSEDTEHNDEHGNSQPNSSSTPKEKPKLSREDRKMEAILRAIEKMERNQQRKQEQKQTKRQNSSSHNTTPTSPNKTFDSADSSAGGGTTTTQSTAKRTNSQTGTRTKKKRKAGNKGGQGGSYGAQRKRRQSRMNSQESHDDCHPHNDHDAAMTSESDGGGLAMHSPPIQTLAMTALSQQTFSSPSATTTSATVTSSETTLTNTVDQAAGLLMAFANPATLEEQQQQQQMTQPEQQQQQQQLEQEPKQHQLQQQHQHLEQQHQQLTPQSPQRPAQYILNTNEASPPPTPPSQVSSACLLIEAAMGPLETNLDNDPVSSELNTTEFKYPLLAKTKKHLMNNWLHQSEEMTAPEVNNGNTLTQTEQPETIGCSTGGLDSLLQAAMSDFKQTHAVENNAPAEEPQNLSIVAQKVEEFIQQTENSTGGGGGATATPPPLTKHSYEYERHQQQQYTATTTPAVDLSLKTLTTIPGSNMAATGNPVTKNFNLPLQVSTCSNNSSVKKRWLRQAISEETHEELHQQFSMTPSPTTQVNTYVNPPTQQQTAANVAASCSPAAMTNHVPNGFTTPLKKRRLLLAGKDDIEDNLTQNFTELQTNTPSPPALATQQAQQMPTDIVTPHQTEQEQTTEEFKDKEKSQIITQAQMQIPQEVHQEDADVDVEKCEMNDLTTKHDLQPKLELEQEQEHDVDVMSSPKQQLEEVNMEVGIKTEVVTKHEMIQEPKSEIKQEEDGSDTPQQHHGTQIPIEFQDQEDDVDILRSPSPGREMIKAEDNLVKIEPEDTSGTEDVKIDVEREESMAADDEDNMVTDQQQKQLEVKHDFAPQPQVEEIKVEPSKVSIVNVKQEVKLEINKASTSLNNSPNMAIETKHENSAILNIKSEDSSLLRDLEDGEPKAKRPKLEEISLEQKPVNVKQETTNQEKIKVEPVNVKQDIKKKVTVSYKNTAKEVMTPHSNTTATSIKKDICKAEKRVIEKGEVSSTTCSAGSSVKVATVAADSTFAGNEAATPPPAIVPATASNLQRHKSLSDDDIQARLHSFHKENILFLQSRNKKTKSSSNSLANSNEHHKNSKQNSSANHQHHHHHNHEGKEVKEKVEKSGHKHNKTTSNTAAASSGSTKKQKLHKRERTSSSSSSNSHKNSTTTTQISSTTSPAVNKSNLVNSSSNSSIGSTKKLKSLKKSSSGSSTSSHSSSSNSSTANLQNSYPSTSTVTGEKEKQRPRTTSASSTSAITSNTPLTPYPQTKKRQLNFELELTKDMHLVNSIGKHKRDLKMSLCLTEDGHGHIVAKKSRKDSSSMHKEENKNGTNKQVKLTTVNAEKSLEKKSMATLLHNTVSTKAQQPQQMACSTTTSMEEVKSIPTIITQSPVVSLPPPSTPTLRDQQNLCHLNNIVMAPTPGAAAAIVTALPSTSSAQQSQSSACLSTQNIPNHVNNPSFITTTTTHHNHQQPHTNLPPTPPTAGSGISSPSVNSNNQLPFYNTIYGKLLENPSSQTPAPTTLTTPVTPSNTPIISATTPPPSILGTNASAAAVTTGVLSEYQDTKLKSYNTLGGYVSHTALFGLNNTSSSAIKENICTTTCTTLKDAANEMPAPLAPPPPQTTLVTISSANTSTSCVNAITATSSLSSSCTTTPLKILTKTASHDPRLNPHLTAPEPPPQPKRKLSINEYRKRMQQSSSNDSQSGSLATTPTTPPTPMESSSSVTLTTNKCTLNSPDRLTQSVDSQIQKEIMYSSSATTTATTTASSHHNALDSLNSSNSSTTSNSSLNDTLLKSSSFVEEDPTKGQFNAAPTLLEKQQESLCARLKSLKEKQSLGASFSVGGCGNRSRFSSFSESVASSDFGLRKDDDDMDIIRNRNHSISSSIGGGDLLDNCLEEISSTSTSMSSSREPSPERYTTHHKILTASATTTMTNTTTTGNSNNGQNRQQQQQHSTSDKNDMVSLERKKSVDIA